MKWMPPCTRAVAVMMGITVMTSVSIAQNKPAITPDIHFTPTRHAVVDAMLQLAKVTPTDVVYDLGSGDGRVPIIAAQKYGARAVGVEIDLVLVEQARRTARDAGVADRVEFIHGDLFAAELSRATVVVLYLSPSVNRRLAPKMEKELAPGTRVVSHQFPVPGWTPTAHTRPDYSDIYLYRVPAR